MRPAVSDEQKNYERYVQPYEDTGAPEPTRAEPERAEPRSNASGAQRSGGHTEAMVEILALKALGGER